MSREHQTVLILDFGGQYTQLIARRVRENRVYCEIHPADLAIEEIERRDVIAVILSGGPQSVYEEGAVRPDPKLLESGVPVLGICYGMQLMAHQLGGEVEASAHREYGRAEIELKGNGALFDGCERRETVWMSHGDRVGKLPPGFSTCAATDSVPIIAFEHRERALYGIQFHPEVSHTVSGDQMLQNFLHGVCGANGDWGMASFLEETIEALRESVPEGNIICGLSGGVDSSVVAVLLDKAFGDRVKPVFVDNGLLRKNESEQVLHALRDGLGLEVIAADAGAQFLSALAGVVDPEQKRRIIGRVFIEVFEEQAQEISDVRYLAQGTLYPDVIESVSVNGPSATIKTHHNVGGLPEKLGFELIEPLRTLFKDEVRQLGRELRIPEALIGRHPFPGPGLAVRILGEVTDDRTALLREADAIFLHELREAGFYDKVSQAFAVLLPVKTVGVMGDYRTYDNVVALRAVETQDFMTADWCALPHDLLGRAANRIINEVDGVNRVVYDITSKPPATIEWE